MKLHKGRFIPGLLLLALLACGDPRNNPAPEVGTPPSIQLEFVSDLNIVTGTPFEQIGQPPQNAVPAQANPGAGGLTRDEILRRKSSGAFGGISAIAYDDESSVLYALSDSSDPVFFTFELQIQGSDIRITPLDAVRLTDHDGGELPPWTLDPEGLALAGDSSLYVSSEGYAEKAPPVDPAVFEFERSGRLNRRIPVPRKFLVEAGGDDTGIRHNRGFESLTIAPNRDRLFTATEGTLWQDGIPCGARNGCSTRIIEYSLSGEASKPIHEYAYEVSAMTLPAGFENATAGNGLVELLSLGNRQLLSLERGFARVPDSDRFHQQIHIYQVDLGSATDISAAESLRQLNDHQAVRKTLLLDLADIVGELSPGFQSLDNFEGMCLGPVIDGDRTIILVSDNNYLEWQRTAFLVFKLRDL